MSEADSLRTCSKAASLSYVQDSVHDDQLYSGYIDIRGPYSPLEITYSAMTNVGHGKRVRSDRDSIKYKPLERELFFFICVF